MSAIWTRTTRLLTQSLLCTDFLDMTHNSSVPGAETGAEVDGKICAGMRHSLGDDVHTRDGPTEATTLRSPATASSDSFLTALTAVDLTFLTKPEN